MLDYDTVDPARYATRFTEDQRELYSHDHWRPVMTSLIAQYCHDNIVLDLACGTGDYTPVIAGYASQTIGLDISHVMLGYAHRQNPALELMLANAYHIPIKDASIDTVVCSGLYEYIRREAVTEEIQRILKPGGTCLILCPNRYSALRLPAKIWFRLRGKNYSADEPSCSEMQRLLKRNHLVVCDSIMDDGLVWMPKSLDRRIGYPVYKTTEKLFKLFKRNPWSNVMVLTAHKEI